MTSLISEGLTLMVMGMGTVFVFLTFLVISTMAMSRIIGKLSSPEPEPAAARAGSRSPSPQQIAAVAALAKSIHQSRQ